MEDVGSCELAPLLTAAVTDHVNARLGALLVLHVGH